MFLSLLEVNVGDNPDRPQPGRNWLRDIYRVHQRLWMAFPDAERQVDDPYFLGAWTGPGTPEPKPKRRECGFLFRIERDGRPRILVQSVERPNWVYAFQNAPYLLARDVQVRRFDPAPRQQQAYRFRLLANVVRNKSFAHPEGKTRTTRAGVTIAKRKRKEVLVHPEAISDPLPLESVQREQLLLRRWAPWRKWLEEIGAVRGFRIAAPPTPLLMEVVHLSVRKPGGDRDIAIEKRFNAGLFEGKLVCTDRDRLRDTVIDGIGHAKAFGFGLLSLAPLENQP